MTLGSLFDGSGGFPLGGIIAGIRPLWASEVTPFPICVTRRRLPSMSHLGDISLMKGGEVPPVDIITFGSPCQNLSISGDRTGLSGEKSSLFFEAVRIVKEMREATDGRYPRYIVWENVAGALFSSGGEDFRSVLEAVIGISLGEVHISRPEKWPGAGYILGEGFSVAWRLLDSQYWGVAQRRRRVYLVADFAGQSAPKVLFDSEQLPGYSPSGFRTWQASAGSSSECTGDAGGLIGHIKHPELIADTPSDGKVPRVASFDAGVSSSFRGICYIEERSPTLTTKMPPVALAIEHHPQGKRIRLASGNIVPTLTVQAGNIPLIAYPEGDEEKESDQIPIGMDPRYLLRKLTPVECARLQGFPDWWTADLGVCDPSDDEMAFWREVFDTDSRIMGKKRKTDREIRKWLSDPKSETVEYTMWGNGVALPCVYYVLYGISHWSSDESLQE